MLVEKQIDIYSENDNTSNNNANDDNSNFSDAFNIAANDSDIHIVSHELVDNHHISSVQNQSIQPVSSSFA